MYCKFNILIVFTIIAKYMTVLLWIGKVSYLEVEKRFKIAPKWSRVVYTLSVSKQCSTWELKLLHNWNRTGFGINGLVLKCTRDWAGYNILSIKFCAILVWFVREGTGIYWADLKIIFFFFNILLFFGLLVLVGASVVGLVYIYMSKAAIMWQKQY